MLANPMCSFGLVCTSLVTISLAFASTTASGTQVLYGSIVGNVTDAQGAVMHGVTLTATNTGTGLKVGTVSDEAGAYDFRNMLPGTYDLTATLTGFREHQQTGIPVTAGTLCVSMSRLRLSHH